MRQDVSRGEKPTRNAWHLLVLQALRCTLCTCTCANCNLRCCRRPGGGRDSAQPDKGHVAGAPSWRPAQRGSVAGPPERAQPGAAHAGGQGFCRIFRPAASSLGSCSSVFAGGWLVAGSWLFQVCNIFFGIVQLNLSCTIPKRLHHSREMTLRHKRRACADCACCIAFVTAHKYTLRRALWQRISRLMIWPAGGPPHLSQICLTLPQAES